MLDVLLDAGCFFAVNKPAGLPAHATVDGQRQNLLDLLRRSEAAAGRSADDVFMVHRLDRDTTGVTLVARGREAARVLGETFAVGGAHKTYLALVAPVPVERTLTVEHHLAPRREGGTERMEIVRAGGQQAITKVSLEARGRRLGLVRCEPHTGRKHQIRAALASIGAPIAGDFLYGGPMARRLAPRVMLHAAVLVFPHPETGAKVRIEAQVPSDMRGLFLRDGGELPPRWGGPAIDTSGPRRSHRTAPSPARGRR